MSQDVTSESKTACKLVPYTDIVKLKGGDKLYQDALEASSLFNKRLIKDRKMRIPFIDSQTRVAQANSTLWPMKFQRQKVEDASSNPNGYVYCYSTRKWYKQRRLNIEPNDSYLFPNSNLIKSYQQHMSVEFNPNLNGEQTNNSDSSNLLQHQQQQLQVQHHQGHHNHHGLHNHNHHSSHGHSSSNQSLHQILNKQSSNDDHDNEPSSSASNYNQQQQQQQQNHNLYSNHHSNNHLHDDSFDNFDLNDHDDSDQDDYEESRKKKKRGGKQKKKNEASAIGDEKPFICDRCGVKYKTKPGLAYHIQKAHSNNNNNSGVGASGNANLNLANQNSKQHSDIFNPDENTVNSVFESGYDDMNSSSSLPHVSSGNTLHQPSQNQMYLQHYN